MKNIFLGITITLIALLSFAEVSIPEVFDNHMVLQRNVPVKIWGWADRGEKVTIKFNGQVVAAIPDRSGKWMVTLEPMNAGGPFEMTISGRNTITLTNILIGEVWICSGQSNMEWQLANTNNADEVIAEADHPEMRLFTVPRKTSTEPLNDVEETSWEVCTPETISRFSAVAYYFGKYLQDELNVPVGLINTTWGGTNVETWTSIDAISQVDGFEAYRDKVRNFKGGKTAEEHRKKIEEITGKIEAGDRGWKNGKAVWAASELDRNSWNKMEVPGLWESSGLEGLDGFVWFATTVNLPEGVSDGMLHLGPIDDSDWTYVNGHKIGATEQKYDQQRTYEIPAEVLRKGKNTIVVRVEDTGGGGGMWGDAEAYFLETGNRKVSLAGEWRYKVGGGKLSFSANPNALPSLLYNGMVHGLVPYTIQGSIWYQGESNAGRAYQYRELFPTMINDWRSRWDQGDFPFLFVQLANFMEPADEPGDDAWAELREAQLMALSLPNTGMAVTIDIGEADDIHPRNKYDVGKRLALNALKIAYDQDIVYSGPIYKLMEVKGDEVILTFDHVGSGLVVQDKYGYLKGFAIAGKDQKFYWAKARIENNKVVVYSDKVQEPVAVRYAWGINPEDANLYNEEGLPASPFRTDGWKGITHGKMYNQ